MDPDQPTWLFPVLFYFVLFFIFLSLGVYSYQTCSPFELSFGHLCIEGALGPAFAVFFTLDWPDSDAIPVSVPETACADSCDTRARTSQSLEV